jgi:hypothetical protein
MRYIRSKLTFANVIALLALFVALGGSAYAIHLGKNAVKTRNIKNSAVTEAKLAPGAVTAEKLAAGALGAANVGNIVVRRGSVSLPDGVGSSATARCAPGEKLLGGGGTVNAAGQADVAFEGTGPVTGSNSAILDGDPVGSGAGLTGSFHNLSGGFTTTTFGQVYVFCLK